ncbi:MAG: DUF1611 domain-containing protein [Flavobacteriales bacterium]
MLIGAYPKAKCIGVSLNTSKLNEKDAKKIIHKIHKSTGLNVTDPIRFGVDKICLDLF